MKLKYNFSVKTVENENIATCVGADSLEFKSLITLSQSGKILFELLKDDVTEEQLTKAIIDNYNVSPETAAHDVDCFLETLMDNGLIAD